MTYVTRIFYCNPVTILKQDMFMIHQRFFCVQLVLGPAIIFFNIINRRTDHSTLAQMAVRSPHDQKVVRLNPTGSYETRF